MKTTVSEKGQITIPKAVRELCLAHAKTFSWRAVGDVFVRGYLEARG